jgi:galactokinase
VALVNTNEVDAVIRKIAADYQRLTAIQATQFVSRPAAGATVLKA